MATNPISGLLSGITGIDTDTVVNQLMTVERQPLQSLTNKKAAYDAKITAYGNLSSALARLKSSLSSLKSTSILGMTASSSDVTVFTATATAAASEGAYNIKVSNVATKQSVYSEPFLSGGSAVADLSSVATQKLKIQVGSATEVEVTVDSTNNTLNGVRDAINAASAGVTASVVNDGLGYRLALSSNTTGASSRITVKADEDNDGVYSETGAESDTTGLSKLALNATYAADGSVTGGITNMTQSQGAVDASLVVDGLTITRDSNTITDILGGVTLNLLNNSAGKTLILTVAKDTQKIKDNVNGFISSYNTVMGLARSLSTSTPGKSVILAGDSTANGIINQLNSAITASYGGTSPVSLGLSHDKQGNLSVDTKILDSAVKAGLQGVTDTFDGMATSLESNVTDLINIQIPARNNGLNISSKGVQRNIDNLTVRLQTVEATYRKQFAALGQTLAQLQSTGNFLSQRLASITNSGSSSSGG
ncbi:MAG: flagellar filament capping protein FliD [Nitrospirae bacterium]|nr:flagellar filament capping protein FliD [Candidatus Manganitrophaceae bacterium]